MCGIAGWISFQLDLERELPALSAMTDDHDAARSRRRGHLAGRARRLGHRRLAVIDLDTGDQPMTVDRDGDTAAVITYSGEVYNYRELRAELAGLGHPFRTASDTEVVLRAYLEWGDDFVDRLNGMYAFGLWDARRQRLLLVRDRMGIKPLYVHTGLPGAVLFASEPKGVFAHPAVDPVVDTAGLRELLAVVKTPGHGLYRDLHEVKPGEVVTVDRTGLRRRRYWRPGYVEHRDDRDTTVHTVRELLDDIVRRQVIADVPLCTLLSGGLDSSAITALAAAALREGGDDRLRSFAVDFVGQTENFRPDPMRDAPDGPYVHDVAKHVAIDHEDIVLDAATLMDPVARSAVVSANDLPVGLGDLYTSLYLLFRAVREHSTVALSGESADEVFGGYRWFHTPETVATEMFPWLAPARRPRRLGLGAHPRPGRRLDLAGYRRALPGRPRRGPPMADDTDPQDRRMREICYLHLTRFVQILLDRKDRMSMAHGLEVRVPFCDHRLVEYVYNTPWAMKTFDGREKSLLRAAVRDILPTSVVERRKALYPHTQQLAYVGQLQRQVGDLLSGDHEAVALFDRAALAGAVGAQPEAVDRDEREAFERVLDLAVWLDLYRPTVKTS